MLSGMDVMNPGVLYQPATGFKAPPDESLSEQMASSEEFLQHFGLRLAQLIAPATPIQAVQQAIRQTLCEATGMPHVPAVRSSHVPKDQRQLELVFVHDCRNHGCNRLQCVLCKHNPNKRCTGNFAHKYWVGDKLLAKCEGEIQVEVVDGLTGERATDDLTNMRLELCILDGNKFNSRCREIGEQRMQVLDECEVLKNQKGEPLMVAGGVANTVDSPQVVLKFQPNELFVSLKEVKVTESSESVLAGTKRPPFRMVVRAVKGDGTRLNIKPAVSEEFVVVTKRTKNLKKQEIPSLDDPISKLNHIGKETVKKLNEIKASADEMNLDLKLPRELWRVTKVREFQKVAKLCDADGHMQQKLKQLLKLSKEKWDAACEHAKTAVQVDNRMRAWYIKNMSVGLLYQCSLGDLRLDSPVALLQNRRHEGVDFMEVVPMEHQLPAQRDQVQASCEQAMRLWWEDYHPGWMIFTLGNQHFETLNQIIQYSQSSMIKGGLTPLQEDVEYGGSEMRAAGFKGDIQGYAGKGLHSSDRRDSLSFGGQHPWSAQGGGPEGLASRGGQHMSAQEESAALLNQMFAQQMAGNAPYPDPDVSRALPSRPRPSSVLFDSRVMPSQPPLGMFDAHEGGQGGASEGGGGSRSSAPNPFEDLTRLPFKSQIESGKRDGSALAGASWNGPNGSWIDQIGGLGSVNSELNHNNAGFMTSLLSLSNFAKNNSLGSFNSHNLAEVSNLPSVNGEEALPGLDSKGKGQGGRQKAPGQFQQPQGPAGRSPRGELGPDLQNHVDPRRFQDHPGDHFSGRGHKEEEKDEGEQYTQGLFLKQLQQQRQQKHDHNHHPDFRSRDSTPPGYPRHEPDHARSKPPSGDPKARDPRAAHPSSPYHDAHAKQEQFHEQGRADPGSPWNQHEGMKARPSTFLSELQQAIEPALNSREPKQKRKRAAGSSDQPKRTKQKRTGSDSTPGGGASQTATAVAPSQSPKGQDAGPQHRPEAKAIGPQGHSAQQPSSEVPEDTQQYQQNSQDAHGHKVEDPSPIASLAQDQSRDQFPSSRQSTPRREEEGKEDSPALLHGAADKGQPQGDAHGLDRMVEHLAGHLPSSADEEAAQEQEEEGGTEEQSTDSDGKHSQQDVDVVN